MHCQKQTTLLKTTRDKTSEKYFFKYAFPCAQAKLKLGSLSPEQYKKLKETFLKNDTPTKETLEEVFAPAFRRIKKLSNEEWDIEVLKKYWRENHNEIINQGDGMYGLAPEEFNDLCKIHEAEIIEKHQNKLIVKYNNKTRTVLNFLVPDANIGDKVTIHFAFAIEKI